MKTTTKAAAALGLATGLAMLGGCRASSSARSVASAPGWETVAAPPAQVTAAAEEALDQMKFSGMTVDATAVVGKLTAKSPHNDLVTVDVIQAGRDSSTVRVRTGADDPVMSQEIIDKIISELHSTVS